MLTKFMQREKRFVKSEKIAFFVLPLVLIPLVLELALRRSYPEWFVLCQCESPHQNYRIVKNMVE